MHPENNHIADWLMPLWLAGSVGLLAWFIIIEQEKKREQSRGR